MPKHCNQDMKSAARFFVYHDRKPRDILGVLSGYRDGTYDDIWSKSLYGKPVPGLRTLQRIKARPPGERWGLLSGRVQDGFQAIRAAARWGRAYVTVEEVVAWGALGQAAPNLSPTARWLLLCAHFIKGDLTSRLAVQPPNEEEVLELLRDVDKATNP